MVSLFPLLFCQASKMRNPMEIKIEMKLRTILLIFMALWLISAWEGNGMAEVKKKMDTTSVVNNDLTEHFKIIANKKIYFGHQSVGANMIDGIIKLMEKSSGTTLHFERIHPATDFSNPSFFHSLIGSNEQPESKISDFEAMINLRFHGNVDIAFMKFCYLDVDPDTDVNKLFDKYQKIIDNLQKKYPNITFVHVTIPLKSLQSGPKSWVKRMLGRPVVGYEDNANREKYNSKMRDVYKDAHLFDLAAIESTYLSGEKAMVEVNGKMVPYLVSDFTDDGGHLNELGQQVIATQLVKLLASLIK